MTGHVVSSEATRYGSSNWMRDDMVLVGDDGVAKDSTTVIN